MASDPLKSDRGTTAILEIDGFAEPIRNITQFSVSDDCLQVGDTMNVVVPDPKHELWKRIELFAGYRFYLQNPAIDGGVPCLRQTGFIRGREHSASLGGDVISLHGADKGWCLQTSAPEFYRLESATLRDLLSKLIIDNPQWGFKDVLDQNDVDRRLMQGRLGEKIRLNPSRVTPYLVIQIEPGQQIIEVIREYARRDGLMVNVTSDGSLQYFNPNYDQPISFSVNYHSSGSQNVRYNNVVLDSRVEENGDLIFTEVVCVWEQLYVPNQRTPNNSPNLGRHCAIYTRKTGTVSDLALGLGTSEQLAAEHGATVTTTVATKPLPTGPRFPRRYTFVDSEPMTAEQGARRVVWEAQRKEFDAFVYRCTLTGHSQNGKWFTSDTMASVYDSIRGIAGNLYVPTVRLDGTKDGGNTSYFEMRKPGLLSNAPLKLNTVTITENGVFVEVQVPG